MHNHLRRHAVKAAALQLYRKDVADRLFDRLLFCKRGFHIHSKLRFPKLLPVLFQIVYHMLELVSDALIAGCVRRLLHMDRDAKQRKISIIPHPEMIRRHPVVVK